MVRDGLHLTNDRRCRDGQARGRHDRSHLLRWRWHPDRAGSRTAPADPNATCFAATAPQGTPSPESGRGYWLLDSKGHVFGFGAANLGDLTSLGVATPPVSIQSTPTGEGYWIVDQKGQRLRVRVTR